MPQINAICSNGVAISVLNVAHQWCIIGKSQCQPPFQWMILSIFSLTSLTALVVASLTWAATFVAMSSAWAATLVAITLALAATFVATTLLWAATSFAVS